MEGLTQTLSHAGQEPLQERIFEAFKKILEIPPGAITDLSTYLAIPKFTSSQLFEVCSAMTDHFRQQRSVLYIQGSVWLVGDIHGNLLDLVRILGRTHLPPESRLLFLGDYVDRGPYSIHVVMLLFSLTLKFPDSVFLIRGNHEFIRVNARYGFKTELEAAFPSEGAALFEAFNDCFNWIPIAAVVAKDILCVHGGISPSINSLKDLEDFTRPVSEYNGNFLADLMWSDPLDHTQWFQPNPRGVGRYFGESAVRDFVDKLRLRCIVRAHQCIARGVEAFAGELLYTVFSCSNYHGSMDNACGLLHVDDAGTISSLSLPPLPKVFSGRLETWPTAPARAPAAAEVGPAVLARPLPNTDRRRSSLTPGPNGTSVLQSQILAGVKASHTGPAVNPLAVQLLRRRAGLNIPMIASGRGQMNP
jgi:protein phosphatase